MERGTGGDVEENRERDGDEIGMLEEDGRKGEKGRGRRGKGKGRREGKEEAGTWRLSRCGRGNCVSFHSLSLSPLSEALLNLL